MDQPNISEIIKKSVAKEEPNPGELGFDLRPRTEERGEGRGSVQSSKDLEAILKKQIEAIEAGKVSLVDPAILKEAKEAISHETGGVAEPRAELQHFLDMLQGGDINDPASALERILNASEKNQENPNLN
ncbi:MAG: hypothetical protein AAB410_02885 [Patescibacteria group bacterium]